MASHELIINVFISSPLDLIKEREALDPIIEQINREYGRDLRASLRLLKYEKDVIPGFAEDPQQVINNQIGTDYDIFIGILWHRFGSPTPRFLSGTEEEFQQAYQKFLKDPNSISIGIYFKDAPIEPSKVSPDQLARVQNFKEEISQKGGLRGTFTDEKEFSSNIRLFLITQIKEHIKRHAVLDQIPPQHTRSTNPSNLDPAQDKINRDYDEEGIIELTEKMHNAEIDFKASADKITKSHADFGTLIQPVLDDIKRIQQEPTGPRQLRSIKDAFDKGGVLIDMLAQNIAAEINPMSNSFIDLINAGLKLTHLEKKYQEPNQEKINSLVTTFKTLKEAIKTNIETQLTLKTQLNTIPPLTTVVSKAKINLNNTIDLFVRELDNFIKLIDSTIESI